MPKHRAELLLMSEKASREELVNMLRHADEWLAERFKEDYPEGTVEALIFDDMEDE
jgi:hypothetical protein